MKRTALARTVRAVGLATLAATTATAQETINHQLVAGPITYHYRALGTPHERLPLIMITRYRANMDDWDPAFLAALAQTRQVIVFNQEGVASTNGEPRASIAAMAQDVGRFIRALGHEQVDVLGWSMGGFTAQALVMDEPALVRRLVLVGTGPAGSPATPGPRPGVFDVATQDTRSDGLTTYSDSDRHYLFFAPDEYSKQLAAESLARVDAARSEQEPVTLPAVREAQTAAIQGWWLDAENPYFARMRQVQHPVLIINGDRDAFFSNEAQALMMSTYPHAALSIYPNAGHGPHHQHPKRVAALIERFLR